MLIINNGTLLAHPCAQLVHSLSLNRECVCLEVKYGGWKALERKCEGKLFWSVFG